MSWLSLRFYKAVYTSASFILLLFIYWKFHVIDGQNRSLIFRVKRMLTSFPIFLLLYCLLPQAGTCSSWFQRSRASVSLTEAGMVYDIEWWLVTKDYEAERNSLWLVTLSDSFCANCSQSTVAIWRPVSIETSHWFLAPDKSAYRPWTPSSSYSLKHSHYSDSSPAHLI